jgi:hypothetical protein
MKVIGSTTHIGVTLKELNRIYKEDAVIPVSKKALKAYMMAAGIEEDIKPISLQVTDNTEKEGEEKKKERKFLPMPTPEEQEMAPPLDINISDGDW